jgi:hypothetical protein
MALRTSSMSNEPNRPEPKNASELLEMYDKKPATKMSFKIIIAVVVIMLLTGIFMMLSGGKKGESTGQLVSDISTMQSRIIALSEKVTPDLKTTKARNTLLSLSSVVSTDQKAVSAAVVKAGVILPKKASSSDLPIETQKEIASAITSADYDGKITIITKSYLTKYETLLKTAYGKTKSPSLKTALDKAYSNSQEFSTGL